ncbi:MAG TPA: fructosamine kinase family protein [Gammaproteobacteria bacterium]|nr:fructosamine kinase family protein [Gammaproteobacteria bacterium]
MTEPDPFRAAVDQAVHQTWPDAPALDRWQGVPGGDINRAWRVHCGDRPLFVKGNRPELAWMFEAEARALQEIAASGTVRVPGVVALVRSTAGSALVLEHLELRPLDEVGRRRLGKRLAAMHRVTGPRYGWEMDNTIGSTLQPNAGREDWVAFFRDQRLSHQLDVAENNGRGAALLEEGRHLCALLHGLFDGYRPEPSLLHGDLWGGNAAMDADGEPVIYDPATYWGDRETDIAMTELFGGFGHSFRESYAAAWPMDAGYGQRRPLYQLYHVLNHMNLFGGTYGDRAHTMIRQLLAELRG